MYGKIIFLVLISQVFAAFQDSEFCKLCKCEESTKDVTCNKVELSHLNIFNNSKFWFDSKENKTFDFRNVVIHQAGIGVVTEIMESPLLVLDLSHNRIQNIQKGAFRNLQNMQELKLSNNELNSEALQLNTLQGKYFASEIEPLRSLKVLRLDGNIFHTMHQNFFEHTTKIEVLDLHGNPLKYLDAATMVALNALQGLKVLDLSYTDLKDLPESFFHTLKNLEQVNLTGNEFKKIPSTFEDAVHLRYLNFNNNPIENITEHTGFRKVPSLKILHMSNMPELTHVYNHSLCGLTGLEELYMTDNPKLVHIDVYALSMKGEKVEAQEWPPVKKFYIRNNKLSYMSHELLLHWEELEDVDIRDNPWACECESEWLEQLIKTIQKLDNIKAIGVECASPIEMAGLSLVDLASKNAQFRCLDYYGNRPERDGNVLIGILVGLLIGIPLVLGILYCYKRQWFGYFDKGAAAYSRKFYNRASPSDDGDI